MYSLECTLHIPGCSILEDPEYISGISAFKIDKRSTSGNTFAVLLSSRGGSKALLVDRDCT